MKQPTSDRIATLLPRSTPTASQIIEEVRDSLTAAQAIGVFEKLNAAHMTRRCLWANQHADGMKHGSDAFPWERAIDSRVPLAEEIVTAHVRVRMSAMRSGNVQIGPQNEIEDSAKAGTWNDVLKYYRNQVKRSLYNEMRLFFTCVEEIGYGVLRIDWRDVQKLIPQTVTVEQLMGLQNQLLTDEAALAYGLPPDQLPPELTATFAEDAALIVEAMLMDEDRLPLALLIQQSDPTAPLTEAKRAARELSKTGTATYYAPRSQGGLPKLTARIPWVNCGHALDLGPDGQASWWFDAEWLSEADLRIRATTDDWSDAWLEEALTKPNLGCLDLMAGWQEAGTDWLLNGVGFGMQFDRQNAQRTPMYQVLTVYRLAVNEAGIPACYETVVHPHVIDHVAKHQVCRVADLPWVAEAREAAGLMVQSRGIPEIILTDQLGLKKLKDGTVASAELAAFPPYERAHGDTAILSPGREMFAKRRSGTGGTDSRFMDVPGVDMGALKAMEMIRADVNALFARGPNVDPEERRLFLEELGACAVMTFEEVMRILWAHIQAYVDELHASRIAGRPVSVSATREDLEGTADVTVTFSALALNQKTAMELADYGAKIAGLDRNGRIDFGKFVELITRMFDPALSEQIILTGEEATDSIVKDEQAVLAAIASGQYITGRINSPQIRYQEVQKWLQNPEVSGMLQANPMKGAALMEHVKGLQQEQVQSSTNVFTGQTGQKPEAPWEEQEQPVEQTRAAIQPQQAA